MDNFWHILMPKKNGEFLTALSWKGVNKIVLNKCTSIYGIHFFFLMMRFRAVHSKICHFGTLFQIKVASETASARNTH